MAHPIWRDYILSLPLQEGANFVEFSIAYGNNTIYSGKAYAKPTSTTAEIKINDICADYLANALPSTFPNTGGESHSYIYTFVISHDGATTEVEFYYDWSYDYTKDYSAEPILSAPILRKIPRNAPLLYTATAGSTQIEIIDYGAYSRAFSSDFDIGGVKWLNATSVANNVFDLSSYTSAHDSKVLVKAGSGSSIEYALVGDCYRYMLYYLNAFGGWDFLLIEGNDMQTDTYSRKSIGQTYNNAQSRNRGMRNYRNDVTRKWNLRTLWIDDEGAKNMHHLLGSVDVYLYDLQDKQLYPVTINNGNCEYKTYKNNGNKLVRFDIEATLATTITRR